MRLNTPRGTTLSRLSCCVIALMSAMLWRGAADAQVEDPPVVERLGPDHLRLRWSGPDALDIYVSAQSDAPLGQARLVAAGDAAGVYDFRRPTPRRPYFILRDRSDNSLWRVAERVLPLEQGSNFRDLGGYPAADHKHVRWGLIYRTAANPMLTDGDFGYVRQLGLKADVDLRATDERTIYPDALPARTGARYVADDYKFSAPDDAYRVWLTSLAPQFRAVFQALLRNDGAVSFHCSAGQDRTGIAAALVLSALGVPRNVIIDDYLLSMRYRRPRFEFRKLDPAAYPGNGYVAFLASIPASELFAQPDLYDANRVPYLEQTFEEIDRRWGDTPNYLQQELGVGPAEIAKLRAIYLE
ncbi:MAG: tyrosine-protein phosphatase [Caulobacteraceae bacterium]|nr:tyrosine-protein phosphatase [Caulobacteraceae bacterium]